MTTAPPVSVFRPARAEWTVVALLTAVALLLPTHNSTPDAWYYAACVRHGHELLLPHHLLYNAVGWLWMHLLPASVDTLAGLKVMNALAFGGCLLVLRDLLRRVGGPMAPVAGWLLVAGSSFGMLRFATENETYMLPLLLSLLASRSWWRGVSGQGGTQSWVAAGAWSAAAALLHQIHAFWGVGLLLGILMSRQSGRWKFAGLYALPALLVPVAYAAALPTWNLLFTPESLWRFIFYELYHGHAGATLSGRTLLLTAINLVRTFGQLHGTTLSLLQRWPALGAVGLLCIGVMVYAGWHWWKAKCKAEPAPLIVSAATPTGVAGRAKQLFFKAHLLILVLQLACAAWAAGNAEFMVMLPSLLALLLIQRPWSSRPLVLAGTALLLWNLTFGLVPLRWLRLTNTASLLARTEQEATAWWLLSDPNLVLNQLHYRTGQPIGPPTILSGPALLVQQPGQSPEKFRAWLKARRAAGQRVYTDVLGGPQLLDRARLTQGGDEAHLRLLRGFQLVRTDSFPTFFGPVYLTEIR
ncbi:hypothetical protein [Hymenobacter sediminicola]|uniref:Glycosyltransferase RgtA/B/C/D-like domain-containing protein n=1 Tax=Hymenobacter sediminicola TaxID=2761579 RepID=A0A7G7W5W7_9BACT|nr:hypothetical protein [Hymenobacter sediminicola]QNH61760.1 hypothetical protein H4317_16635 [Hymenobacter sediminicola]